MNEIAILLLTAAVGATIARRFKLPSIPLLLFAGWLLSLTGFLLSEAMMTKALELGVAFLAFASGVELDSREGGRRIRFTLPAALFQMFVSALLAFALSLALGLEVLTAIYLAIAVSISSTLVSTRQLRRLGQTQEPFARFSKLMLVSQDAVVIVVIALLAAWGSEMHAWPIAVLGAVLLLALAIILRGWMANRMEQAHRVDDESLLLGLLATLFAFLGIASFLGLPIVVGAFCGGLVFSRFPSNGIVRGQLSSLTDFFAALFFTTLAQLSVSPTVMILLEAFFFTGVILVSRFFLGYLLARRAGLDSRGATESALLLAQVGEYALVIGLIALERGVFGHNEMALLGLIAAFTMMITPLVAHDRVASLILQLRRRIRPLPQPGAWEGHVLMIGYGAGGKWVARPLRKAGIPFVVIDDDPAVVEMLRQEQIPSVLGDGTDPAVLQSARVDQAKAVLASPRRVSDGLKVLRHVRDIPVIVRVFEQSEAEAAKLAGGIPIRNSLAAAEQFMEWYAASGKISQPKD